MRDNESRPRQSLAAFACPEPISWSRPALRQRACNNLDIQVESSMSRFRNSGTGSWLDNSFPDDPAIWSGFL